MNVVDQSVSQEMFGNTTEKRVSCNIFRKRITSDTRLEKEKSGRMIMAVHVIEDDLFDADYLAF